LSTSRKAEKAAAFEKAAQRFFATGGLGAISAMPMPCRSRGVFAAFCSEKEQLAVPPPAVSLTLGARGV
jgi:hypothetical protein